MTRLNLLLGEGGQKTIDLILLSFHLYKMYRKGKSIETKYVNDCQEVEQ